jgi:hypothetical protein
MSSSREDMPTCTRFDFQQAVSSTVHSLQVIVTLYQYYVSAISVEIIDGRAN